AFPLRAVKNRGYSRFLTHLIERRELHEVRCALDTAAFLGADIRDSRLELWPTSKESARARERLLPYRNRGMGLIALAPGGGLGRRLWPARSFARLAACLVERTNAVILLMGGPGEEGIAEQVISASGGHLARILNVVGKVSLGEAAALLGGCDLFIGNDSGPMHMAAAMGVPCVEISCHPAGGDPLGENSPARFAPWGVP